VAPAATTQRDEHGSVNLYDDELRYLPKTMDRIETFPRSANIALALTRLRTRLRMSLPFLVKGVDVGKPRRITLAAATCSAAMRSATMSASSTMLDVAVKVEARAPCAGPFIPDERGRLVGIDENSVVVD
jgi:hypothetical protein